MACSIECHDAYMNQVAEARANNAKVDLLPMRTDMTAEEVQELINAPTAEVVANTKDELAGYSEELDSLGLSGAVDLINMQNNPDEKNMHEQEGNIGAALGKTAKRRSKQ